MAMVLIVDDTQTDRELMGRIVASAGHTTAFATDGDEVLKRAKEVKPNLVLMDVVMQRLDGFAACRQLKADPETKEIPVVMVTSKSTPADVFWGKKQGATEYLGKPYTAESLLDVLKRLVK
jgi:twitching motility two-component system response regulator PilH